MGRARAARRGRAPPLGDGYHVSPPHPHTPPAPAPAGTLLQRLAGARVILRQLPGTLRLVWQADRSGALVVLALTLVLALLPAAIAWLGKLIVDGVVQAARGGSAGDLSRVLWRVAGEAGLMAVQMAATRLLGLERDLMRGALGNLVNERILEKALRLELRHFEDSDVYDKMQNARREASSRPLSLALQALSVGQNADHPRGPVRPPRTALSLERAGHRGRLHPRLPRRGAALGRVLPRSSPGARRRAGG